MDGWAGPTGLGIPDTAAGRGRWSTGVPGISVTALCVTMVAHAGATFLRLPEGLQGATQGGDGILRQDGRGRLSRPAERALEALASSLYLQRRNALVEVLVSWFGDTLRQRAGYGKLDFPDYADTTRRLAEEMPPEELSKRIAAAEELRELLTTNVQEILALEVSFLNAFG